MAEADGRESPDEELMQRALVTAGWLRHLPSSAALLMFALAEGVASRQVIAERTGRLLGRPLLVMQSPAWPPLVPWTEEELRVNVAGLPERALAEWPQTADEANEDDRRRRTEKLARVDRYCAALDVPPVRTYGQLFDLMCACRLVVTEPGSPPRYRINPDAPLPGEIVPLTVQERADEDDLRWSDVHDRARVKIVHMFEPDGDRHTDRRTASLRVMAGYLDLELESVRAALSLLLRDPEFSSDCDPERVDADEPVTITVDWEMYDVMY